ncbi:MAG: exodeoxyribonuclease III [Thermoguttaceae bacterium]
MNRILVPSGNTYITMRIATWNVNSVRARLDRLLAWLSIAQPDIVCLQELKTREETFPYEAIREAGYHAAVFGQRTFNGVGILSRIEPQNVRRGMDDTVEDPQARFITAQVGGIQVISAYIPNGQVVGSAHYAYKLDWLRRLRALLEKNFTPQTPLVVCGDFNVARDELDLADPAAWEETVLYHPTSRAALEDLLSWGLVDVHRQQHPEGRLYSWWD